MENVVVVVDSGTVSGGTGDQYEPEYRIERALTESA
jgi:hypothetical protein